MRRYFFFFFLKNRRSEFRTSSDVIDEVGGG